MTFLDAYAIKIYAVLRILAGLMFAQHGAQKLFGVLGGTMASSPLMYTAGVIELVAGLLIAIGFFARWAAFIASGTMAVAYFMHAFGAVGAPASFFPVVNKGELAALYCWVFLTIAAYGAGPWSVDEARKPQAG